MLVSNVIGFTVVRPEHHDRIFAHTQGLPMIGFRRLQLGDSVYFELPDPRWGTDLELSQLRRLRFADLRAEGSARWEEVIETSDGRSLLLRADAEWGCLFSIEGYGCFRVKQ